jgi:phosphatidate cytidylyltransferase
VLRQRLLLGPVLIAMIILGSWLDEVIDAMTLPHGLAELLGRTTAPPGTVVFAVVSLLAIGGGLELSRIYREKKIAVSRRVVITLALAGLSTIAFLPESLDGTTGAAIMNSAVTLVLIGSLAFYSRHKQVDGMVTAAGGALFAFVYLGMMFGFLVLMRREVSAWVVLWVLVSTKASDIGAYFVGRSIGRHKLIPWLSPGKTWEGFFGGVVFSALVACLGTLVLSWGGVTTISWGAGLVMGVIFGVVGPVGDLVMSLVKRDAGVKDAGTVLPGFGGVLDVIDSVLLAAPAAFWMLRLV